jgi:molecular chaperone DnaK
MSIDANGVLEVSAKDKAVGKEVKVTIEANGGLSAEEVEKMQKDAEANKEADAKLKEALEVKETAKTYVQEIPDIEKQDYFTQASEDARKTFQDVAAKLKTAFEADNTEELKAATEEFKTAKSELGKSFYDAQAKTSNDDTPAEGTAPEADTPAQGTPSKPATPKQGG